MSDSTDYNEYLVSKSIERLNKDLEKIVNKYKKNILYSSNRPMHLWNKIKFIDSSKYFDQTWELEHDTCSICGLIYINYASFRRKNLPLFRLRMEEVLKPKFNLLLNPNQFWANWDF